MTETKWITTTEAAAIMGITDAGVRRMCSHNQIKSQKFGRNWMVDRAAAEAYERGKLGRPSKSKQNG